MRTLTANAPLAAQSEHHTAGVGHGAQVRTGLVGTMPDNRCAAATLQSYQRMADQSIRPLQLGKRLDVMAASPAASSLRAMQLQISAPLQRIADGELQQGIRAPLESGENGTPSASSLARPIPSVAPATAAAQLEQRPIHTALPDQLKSGIESLSGMRMDHVKVHYNSDKPAQLHAHAYAQGSEIHVAPGQERHLPHEAWHVVQQAQGRVMPTVQMQGGVSVNDDVGLETEADLLGAQAAAQMKSNEGRKPDSNIQSCGEGGSNQGNTIQYYRTAAVNGVAFGQRRIYGANGALAGTLAKNTQINISDSPVPRTVTIKPGKTKDRQCYIIIDEIQLNNPKLGADTSVLYITAGGVKDMQAIAAGPLAAQVANRVDVPLLGPDQMLACWNWALYALDDAKTVYELDAVFSLLERQVGFNRGGSEFLPVLNEGGAIDEVVGNYEQMCNNRVINNLMEQGEADQMVLDYRVKVVALAAKIRTIRDDIGDEDLLNVGRNEITRKYNYHLTEVILRDAGFRVLPRDTTGTWKVGQHVEQGTYGWEHWWLRSPAGDYIDHFPGQGNGIRKAKIMLFGYGEDDLIEVPVAEIKPEHRDKAIL